MGHEYDKIYLKGSDKTKNVESIKFEDNVYKVKYFSTEKIYSFKKENVELIKYNDVFEYLIDIAKKTTVNGEFSILGKYYNNIRLKKNDLLDKYLNGTPIEKRVAPEMLYFRLDIIKVNIMQLNLVLKMS